jgi:ADP-ribose 1''-phosphate phosphatase
MELLYKEMSVFDAPKGSILVHACNCRGVWGSGVAAEFKKRFPAAFQQYLTVCLCNGFTILGNSFCWSDNGYQIGCLMTSRDFGARVDPPDAIIESTRKALNSLFQQKPLQKDAQVFSPMFNSGLFQVPWKHTEALLKDELVQHPGVCWTVCKLKT